MPVPDPDQRPETALVETKSIDLERELVDRYQALSSELLRLSLLGIAVTGYFLERILTPTAGDVPRLLMGLAVLLFGLAAAFAIYHRFWSCETFRLFVWSLRFDAAGERDNATRCLTERNARARNCIGAKLVACCLLGLGAISLAGAFIWPLWS